jgi:hypothetical protein
MARETGLAVPQIRELVGVVLRCLQLAATKTSTTLDDAFLKLVATLLADDELLALSVQFFQRFAACDGEIHYDGIRIPMPADDSISPRLEARGVLKELIKYLPLLIEILRPILRRRS